MRTREIHNSLALALFVAVGILAGVSPVHAGSKKLALPAPALAAIEASFPGGKVMEVERGREDGVLFYEVDVKWQGRELEVEVTADGVLGEIQEDVELKTLPKPVADSIKAVLDQAKVRKIEKHDIRGVPHAGVCVQLAKAQIVYEIKACGKQGGMIKLRLDEAGKILAGDDDEDQDDGDDDGDGDDGEGEHEDGGDE